MKPSAYIVASDNVFAGDDGPLRVVYATRTSRAAILPERVVAELLAGITPDAPISSIAFLESLGLVVSDEENELEAISTSFAQATADPTFRHIALLPTAYCNMGCDYCGQTHVKGPQSSNHRDLVRDRVMGILRNPDTQRVRLDWFGGEPLMGFATIRDLARSFMPVVAERTLDWSSVIVTNGALLNQRKIRSLENECGVTHAEITIDGPQEVHDSHRPLKSGKGSFRNILAAVSEALHDPESPTMTFGIRTNVTTANQRRVGELLDTLADHGLAHSRVRVGIKPVHSWGNDVSDIEVQRADFAKLELEWFHQMSERGLNFEVLPDEPARLRGVCVAVNTSHELIDPTGTTFSCSEQPLVASEASSAVGTVDELWARAGAPRPTGKFDDWHETVARGQQGCSTCIYYPTCGGACPKAWSEGNVPCPSYKFNAPQRLDLIATRAGLKPV